MKKPLIIVVAVALINSDDCVLMACRPTGKHMAGYWEFPGGKIEPNETPETALIREIKEELDLDILEKDLFPLGFTSYSYDTHHLLMPLYGTKTWSGTAKPQEQQIISWVPRLSVKDLQLVPADISLIPNIEKL